MKPGGFYFYAVPAARHLWEMKEILYKKPYENPSKLEDYSGFVRLEVREIRYTASLDTNDDIMALFGMTPYAWKTPRAGAERLAALDHLTLQISFRVHVFEKL